VRPAQAHSPDCGTEDDHRQEEEDACDFEPEDSADAAERAQKPADTASNTARSLPCNLAGGAGLCGGGHWLLAGAALGTGRQALTGNASGDAESDTKSAADGLRLHFDLMVTVPLRAWLSIDYRQMQVALKRRWK